MFASCVDIPVDMDRSGDAPPLGVHVDGVAVALLVNDNPFQLLWLLLLLLLWLLWALLLPLISLLGDVRKGPRVRCDGGIDIGGASLCVRRDRPYMHSTPLRSHRAHVGLRWLQRTLDSLQALQDARSRIVFPSIPIC